MKHLFFIFLFVSGLITAQINGGESSSCIISGPTTIEAGSQYSYSIPNGLAQCTSCYDWDINFFGSEPGGPSPATAVGSDMGRTFTLQANSPGIFSLRVTYFNESGCHSCSLSITVEPDCSGIEDDVDGIVVCSFGKSGNVQVDQNIDVGNINRIDWVYDQSLNGNYYTGLVFNDSGDFQVTSTDPSNHFLEAFTFTGPCRGGSYEEIFFRRVVKITGCPAQYDTVRLFSENNSPFMIVAPNPSNVGELIQFEGIEAKDIANIEIRDLAGVERINIKPSEQTFTTEGLTSGLYIVKFTTIEGKIIQKKLAIK